MSNLFLDHKFGGSIYRKCSLKQFRRGGLKYFSSVFGYIFKAVAAAIVVFIAVQTPESQAEPKRQQAPAKIQSGIDSAQASQFARWLGWFVRDWRTCRDRVEKAPDEFRSLLSGSDKTGLMAYFSHSVDNGPKGLEFRKLLIQGLINQSRPSSESFFGLILSESSSDGELRPIGFGGSVHDGERSFELWYVSLGDPDDNDQQLNMLKALFPHPHVPTSGVAERNVWLTMEFVRADDKSLRLYDLSQEMKRFSDLLRAQVGFMRKTD